MRALGSLLIIVWFVLLGTGCSALHASDETAGWDAHQFYTAAKKALTDGEYDKALNYYNKLEARYPYGRYTEQGQLETAYAYFKEDQPDAAISAADRFIKLHPRHPNVDYAYYIRGLASFYPAKNFLEKAFPQNDAERDPTSAHQSYQYFSELIQKFPDSRYSADAQQRMLYLRNKLARYELLVADYYYRRGAYLAAANRGKYVLDNYDRTPSVPDALEMMIKSYRKMGRKDLADDAERVLAKNYPDRAAQFIQSDMDATSQPTVQQEAQPATQPTAAPASQPTPQPSTPPATQPVTQPATQNNNAAPKP